MTLEQTNQLLQLILNSVLMVIASGFLLAGLLLRQASLEQRLHWTIAERSQALNRSTIEAARPALHRKFRYLKQQIRANQQSALCLTIACILLITSTLCLALRSLLNVDELVQSSLILFAVGTGAFLLGILRFLLTLYSSPRSIVDELKSILPPALILRRTPTQDSQISSLPASKPALRADRRARVG